eukprot:TRINITY_DN610_c0_g1_i1.p1 TRINITY_DN610_c0_g1~~TRINITY_DN610_c0_g1_i1.p1  ORF type:complete len:449 (+),score=109.87 TRINITY_DN610_c0_g1_i1:2-1348(+)
MFFFFNDTATTEIYTEQIVGSVRCVQETDAEYMGKKGKKGSSYHSVDEEHKGKSIPEREKEKANVSASTNKNGNVTASKNGNNPAHGLKEKDGVGVGKAAAQKKNDVKQVANENGGEGQVNREDILDENDLFKLISHNKNYDGYDYQLSYEMNPNATIPSEIEELGRFLETKGSEIVKLYESTGRYQEALELKEKLRKAMQAKKQLEKIAVLDFDRPTAHLREIATKFGINLHDPSIKNELLKIQNQNIQDIRSWLENMTGKKVGPGSVPSKESKSAAASNKASANTSSQTKDKGGAKNSGNNSGFRDSEISRVGNNFYINNNYYNGSVSAQTNIVSNFTTNNVVVGSDPSNKKNNEERKGSEVNKDASAAAQYEHSKLIRDILSNMSKMNEQEKSHHTLTRIMNLVIVIISILLFLFTIMLHSQSGSGGAGNNNANASGSRTQRSIT